MDSRKHLRLPKYLIYFTNFELIAKKTQLRDNYVPLLNILEYILAKVKSRFTSQVLLFIAHKLPEFVCTNVINILILRIHTYYDLFRLCNAMNEVLQDTIMRQNIFCMIESRLLWILDMYVYISLIWTDKDKVNTIVTYLKCSGIPCEKVVSRILHNVLLNMCVNAGRSGDDLFEYVVVNMLGIVKHLQELQILTTTNVIEALQFRFADIYRKNSKYVYYDYYKCYKNNTVDVVGVFMLCIGYTDLLTVDLVEHIMCHINFKDFGNYINKGELHPDLLTTITREDKYVTFEEFLNYLCDTSRQTQEMYNIRSINIR